MIILGFCIKKASDVKSIILKSLKYENKSSLDFYYISEMIAIYNSRIFGICIYRSSKYWKDFGFYSETYTHKYILRLKHHIVKNDIIFENIFNGVGFKTPSGEEMSICMRDSGYEFVYQNIKYSAQNGTVEKLGCHKFCGMNYCDDNGCSERKRNYVDNNVPNKNIKENLI